MKIDGISNNLKKKKTSLNLLGYKSDIKLDKS